MAVAQLIDLSNYDSLLVQSTQSRAGTPDWNVFFDSSNGKIEFIRADELATLDLSGWITTGAIQIDVVAAAGTFTRSVWSFITDWFVTGRSFISSAFTQWGNNSTFVIADVTATVITVVDITGLVNETGGWDEVIASVAEANPLTAQEGIKLEAGYAFENQERRTDENLREFDKMIEGSFKFAWAYNFVANNKPSIDADRDIIRGSGWIEYDAAWAIGRIYYGNNGLGAILDLSQPYYQNSVGWEPFDFAKDGNFNEAIQVYWDIAVDATTTTFDFRTYEAISIRTFGQNYDRKESTTDLWILELWAYSSGFAVSESPHLTSSNYKLANILGADTGVTTIGATAATSTLTLSTWTWADFDIEAWVSITVAWFTDVDINGTYTVVSTSGADLVVDDNTGWIDEAGTWDEQVTVAVIAPFTWMSLEKLAVAQTETGFNEADWDFTWVLNNTWDGSLDECVAFLDALAQTDIDIDSGAETVTNGKRVNTWYSYNAAGQIVTNSGADSLGLFIEQIPTADQQGIVFTDDLGNEKTYPFQSQIEVSVGAVAVADTLAWYHSFFLAAFNTSSAITVEDAAASPVKWNVSTDHTANKIVFAFDYDGDTVGWTAGTDKDAVFLCEWDGGATQQKTWYTLSRTAVVSVPCEPWVETNV